MEGIFSKNTIVNKAIKDNVNRGILDNCSFSIELQPSRGLENGPLAFNQISIQTRSKEGGKSAKLGLLRGGRIAKDRMRFGEFIFLLAAKLQYDLIRDDGMSFDCAGFLHSSEIAKLNKYKIHTKSNISSTIYSNLNKLVRIARYSKIPKKKQNSSEEYYRFLSRFFYDPSQLWHLICWNGNTSDKSLVWWLNVEKRSIRFVDENGEVISNTVLKKPLSRLFPDKYMLSQSKLRKFRDTYIEEIEERPRSISFGNDNEKQGYEEELENYSESFKIGVPENWQDLELLIWRLFKKIWRDEEAEKQGRIRFGIDVFGKDPDRKGYWIGVQCKGISTGCVLSVEELHKEIENAKVFPHPLSKLIIVTTKPLGCQLQKKVLAQSTLSRNEKNTVSIEFLSWDEVKRKLWNFPGLWHDYLDELRGAKIYPEDDFGQASATIRKCRDIVGRKKIKSNIKDFILERDSGVLLIRGPAGIGKSTLMANLVHELASFDERCNIFPFFFSWESGRHSLQMCWRNLYTAFAKRYGLSIDPPKNELELLVSQFTNLLHKQASEQQSTDGIRIDNQDAIITQKQIKEEHLSRNGSAKVFIIDAIDESEDPLQCMRLIPKLLPPGTFFIISSRPGRHLDGFSFFSGPGGADIIKLDTPENISDASLFFQQFFPDWSEATIKKIVVKAKSNFLWLETFSSFVNQESLDETNAIRWCEQFGSTEEDPLFALYEKYWLYLYDKCMKSNRPEDLDDVNELAGLLSITYSPVSLIWIQRILGDKWTTAYFERALKYIHQFIEVNMNIIPVENRQEKTYHFSSYSFRLFVENKLVLCKD